MGTPWSLPPWLSWGGRGQGAGGGDVMGPPWGCASVPDTLAHCRDSARVHGASDGAMDRAWGRAGVPDALDTGAHCWDSARPQEAGDGVMEGCASGPVDTLGAVAHCWDSAGPQEAGDAGMDPPWGCASGPVNTLGAVGHCWDSARAPDRPLAVIPPMAFPVDCGAPRRGRQDPARSGRALRDVVDNWSARRRPVPVITLDDDRCDDVIVGDDGDVPPEEVEDLRTHLERRRKQMGDLLDLIPPPPPSLLATQVAAATTPSSCPRPSRPLPRTRTTRTTWRRLVAARAPRPKVGAGGRVPSNLKAVDIGGVAGMATVSVVQPSTTTPPPRSSPAEAAEATWPPSASADGRLVKKGVRRCGEGGVIVAVQAALLSTALSTAAALPTASAAGEVFHFEATAESNAAVASASTAAAGPSDKREADDDAEVDANTKKRAADDAAAEGDAKRARRDDDDVIDLDLDKAVHLLVGSGARHVYRTARPRPLLHLADWTVLPPIPQHAVNNPLRYEPLDRVRDWDEFTRVERDFDYSCRGQGFQVTRVCRVENDRLLHEFQQRVRRLERQCGDVAVLRVYHGTRRANIHSIALRNLDRRHAGRGTNHAWWGVGVNFSPISYYASHYGDQGIYRSMMVFDVVVGRTCSVLSPPEAPLLPQDNPGTPGQRYDTNLKLDPGPQVICKFDDHQFYPAYIIDYTAPPKGHRWFPEAEYYCPWW